MAQAIANASAELIEYLNDACGMPRTPDGGTVECEWVAAADGSVWVPDFLPRDHMPLIVDPSLTALGDCRSQLQAVLDLGASSGRDVLIQPGTYLVSSAVDVSGGTLICESRTKWATIRLTNPSATAAGRTTKNTEGACYCRNIVFDANGAGIAFFNQGVHGCRFDGCGFSRGTAYQLLNDNAKGCIITNCSAIGAATSAGNPPTSTGVMMIGATNTRIRDLFTQNCLIGCVAIGLGANGTLSRSGLGVPGYSGGEGDNSTFDAGYIVIEGGSLNPSVYEGGSHAQDCAIWFRGTRNGGGASGGVYVEGAVIGVRFSESAANVTCDDMHNGTAGAIGYKLDSGVRNIRLYRCSAVAASTHIEYDSALGTPVVDSAEIRTSVAARALVAQDCVVASGAVSTQLAWTEAT